MAKKSRGRRSVLMEFKRKDYRPLGLITTVIVEAVRDGEDVNLENAFEDIKAQRGLNNKLLELLGLKVRDQASKKLVYSPEADRAFQDKTARTNFAHQLKKCAQAAACILDLNAKIKYDEMSGILSISGNKISEKFGTNLVQLDERKQEGMKEIPSYAALAHLASESRGQIPNRGSNTRGVRSIRSPDTKFETACRDFLKVVDAIGGQPTPRQMNALRTVQLRVTKLIYENK